MLALQDTPPRYQRYPEKHHGSYSQVRRPTRTGYPPDAGAGDDARRTVDWAYDVEQRCVCSRLATAAEGIHYPTIALLLSRKLSGRLWSIRRCIRLLCGGPSTRCGAR